MHHTEQTLPTAISELQCIRPGETATITELRAPVVALECAQLLRDACVDQLRTPHSWVEIADALGCSPDTARRTYAANSETPRVTPNDVAAFWAQHSENFEWDELVALRRILNDNDSAFSALRSTHSRDQRQLADQYDALMAAQRPTYPTEEQLRGLNTIATMVRGDVAYGDHLGAPRDVDRQAGRELPKSVSYSSSAHRINIYALAPYRAMSTLHAWAFSEDDLQAFRGELKQRSLRVASEWTHEDGVAFQVFDARV